MIRSRDMHGGLVFAVADSEHAAICGRLEGADSSVAPRRRRRFPVRVQQRPRLDDSAVAAIGEAPFIEILPVGPSMRAVGPRSRRSRGLGGPPARAARSASTAGREVARIFGAARLLIGSVAADDFVFECAGLAGALEADAEVACGFERFEGVEGFGFAFDGEIIDAGHDVAGFEVDAGPELGGAEVDDGPAAELAFDQAGFDFDPLQELGEALVDQGVHVFAEEGALGRARRAGCRSGRFGDDFRSGGRRQGVRRAADQQSE
jgi:hypothetical protein